MTTRKLKSFNTRGFRIETVRTRTSSSLGNAYAYQFQIYKGKGRGTYLGVEHFSADDLPDAKKKIVKELYGKRYRKYMGKKYI